MPPLLESPTTQTTKAKKQPDYPRGYLIERAKEKVSIKDLLEEEGYQIQDGKVITLDRENNYDQEG